jgi:hypothetical protein
MIPRLIDKGLPVFPLIAGGDKPAVANGFKAASNEKAKVDAWFRKHPHSNFGIPTGATSGFFVLDFDGEEGRVSLAAFVQKYGPLPITWRVKTPRGEHRYFRMPDYSIPNSLGMVAQGIDVRADGGYVVGPGSETREGLYRFFPSRGPDDIKIAAAPDWLLELVGKKSGVVKAMSIPTPTLSADDLNPASRYVDAVNFEHCA